MTIIPGGLWFKDHCLKITPNKKTGSVRYRYLGEDWITTDGDDYAIADNIDQQECGNVAYTITGIARTIDQYGNLSGEQHIFVGVGTGFAPLKRIIDPGAPWKFRAFSIGQRGYQIAYVEYESLSGQIHQASSVIGNRDIDGNIYNTVLHPTRNVLVTAHLGFIDELPRNVEYTKYIITGSNGNYNHVLASDLDCGSCDLTIFKNGEIVHTESRQECPEVEIIDDGNCQENEPIKISIKTTPLGFIDVTKTAASQDGQPEAAIPDECVNIYNVGATFSLTGVGSGINYTLIGQYCSDLGCESLTVVRDGDQCGESCPDDTCPSRCGDHICCHDAGGVAV